jgi:predicted transcriptional regulator
MAKTLVMSFNGTPEIKNWLEQQARKDDRSVSSLLRQILEAEKRRRQAAAAQKQTGNK